MLYFRRLKHGTHFILKQVPEKTNLNILSRYTIKYLSVIRQNFCLTASIYFITFFITIFHYLSLQIFEQMIKNVLDNSPGLTNSDSLVR